MTIKPKNKTTWWEWVFACFASEPIMIIVYVIVAFIAVLWGLYNNMYYTPPLCSDYANQSISDLPVRCFDYYGIKGVNQK